MLWSDGYVTEVPYTYGFYNHLVPRTIELCLLYNNLGVPNWRNEFTYCELACGQGLTALGIAALHPQGRVYAMDFNPQHILDAQELARSMGIDNIEFSEKSFLEYLDDASLPNFDYISLHGIYSWISVENRQRIQQFIYQHLKPGGIVSVSYNTLPGWSNFAPVQYLLNYYRKTGCSGDIFEQLSQGFNLLDKLIENRASFFNDFVKRRLDAIRGQRPNYLVHELFNSDWHPMYVTEVLAEMRSAKLTYAGAASILDNIPAFCIPPNVYEHLVEIKNEDLQQLIKDFYLNTQFRRDLYGKGLRRLSFSEVKELLLSWHLVPLVKRDEVKMKYQYGMLGIDLRRVELYEKVIDLIYSGIYSVRDLWEKEGYKHDFRLFRDVIFIFIGLGYIHPLSGDDNLICCSQAHSRKYNHHILESVEHQHQILWLLSPIIHQGIHINYLDLIFASYESKLSSFQKNLSLTDYILNVLENQQLSLADDSGKKLSDRTEQESFIKGRYQQFTENLLPKLKALQILS